MEKIDAINHPYMRTLENELTKQKYKIECLEKRMALIDEEYKNKSDYEKNEAELIKLHTTNDINATKKAVAEKEQYYIKFMASYVEDMEEVDGNYQSLLKEAQEVREDFKPLNDFLNRLNFDALEKNTEAKIQAYKKLKTLVSEAKQSIFEGANQKA